MTSHAVHLLRTYSTPTPKMMRIVMMKTTIATMTTVIAIITIMNNKSKRHSVECLFIKL